MSASALHLVRRATWGPRPGLVEQVESQGAERWLTAQLAPAQVPDPVCDALLRRFPKITRTTQAIRARESHGDYGTMHELLYATTARYTWSERQLLEVVSDFWSNHLNVPCPMTAVWADRHDYDAAVVRRHALGSFEQMLLASSRHPSMLRYLDGATSTKQSPNQNYGRELLELHTVGVDAGYGEADVVAAARVMTGWTFRGDGSATFDEARHDTGAAKVMGWSFPAHAPSDGLRAQASLLSHLAHHPATARRLATKLCLRFVSDEPPAPLVERLTGAYLDAGTQVVPVLRSLFASPEFADSAGAKTRRPLEGLLAAVRTLGAAPASTGYGGADVLFAMARDLGHAPLGWPAPDGYPDQAGAWVSAGATVRRWNRTWELTTRRKPADLGWPGEPLLAVLAPTWGELVDDVVARLLHRPARPEETAAILRFCERTPASPTSASDPWIASRALDVAALVLDVPGHMER